MNYNRYISRKGIFLSEKKIFMRFLFFIISEELKNFDKMLMVIVCLFFGFVFVI